MGPRIEKGNNPTEVHYTVEGTDGHHHEVSAGEFDTLRSFVSHDGEFHINRREISHDNIVRVLGYDANHNGVFDPDDLARARSRFTRKFIDAAPILSRLGYRVSSEGPRTNRFVNNVSIHFDLMQGRCSGPQGLPLGGHFSIEDVDFDSFHISYTVYSGAQRTVYDIMPDGAIYMYRLGRDSFRYSSSWDLSPEEAAARYEQLRAYIDSHDPTIRRD